MKKGTGLNSIPNRFAVLSGIVTSLVVIIVSLNFPEGVEFTRLTIFAATSFVLLPTLMIYLAAKKLTQQIVELKKNTDAIAQGNFDHPIDVDCACEVGGLADSFRGLVSRVNSNVIRMNLLAYTDMITKLPNRTVIVHLLNEIKKEGHSSPCSIMFMDINGFKRINDTYGHHVGDIFLKHVSDRIISEGFNRTHHQLDMCMSPFGELCNRGPKDIVVARLAGDEFVVILPGQHVEAELTKISERIVAAFDAPFACGSNHIMSGISIGVASYPEDTNDPQELLKYSDLAMYVAKRSNDKSFAIFQKSMHDEIEYRFQLEKDLKVAIAQDQIFLHYQPKVNIGTGKLIGVEALARWVHPERGVVSPAEFIPVAEDSGLIIPLGRKVIELALQQSKQWADHNKCRKIAINIAPSQFEADGFLVDTLGLLDIYNVPSKSIELEITESMAMTKFGETQKQLELLREAGISIGIDDFGTGFSNLSQLSRLPFDTLKIDQSLIADIGVEPKNEAIITAVIKMAGALGFDTVAEGIETEQQYRFLEQVECDTIQGYFLGKPMLPADLDIWELRYSHPCAKLRDDIKNVA